MTIYNDYDAWKLENIDLINELLKTNSAIIQRYKHVILICDYLYSESTKSALNEDLEVIFETAFNYLSQHIDTVSNILKKEYRGNIKGMEENAKTINLLLYTQDFENELDDLESATEIDKKKLEDFESKVLSYVESHSEVPDELFRILDDISLSIFDDDYQDINSILYEVALNLNLIDEQLENPIDMVFGFNKEEI